MPVGRLQPAAERRTLLPSTSCSASRGTPAASGYDARYTDGLGGGRRFDLRPASASARRTADRATLSSAGVDLAVRAARASTASPLRTPSTTPGDGLVGDSRRAPRLGLSRHHIYTDGYTQRGDPLGHPAGGDVAPDVGRRLRRRGAWSGTLMLHRGSAYPTARRWIPAAASSPAATPTSPGRSIPDAGRLELRALARPGGLDARPAVVALRVR